MKLSIIIVNWNTRDLLADCLSSIAVIISVIGAKLGYPILDHIVAMLEAFHVIYISGQMLGSAINGLMDTAAAPDLIDKLAEVIRKVESVSALRAATARWAGQRLLAQVDVELPGQLSVPDADRVRAAIQCAVRTRVCCRSDTFVRIVPASAEPLDQRTGAATDVQPQHAAEADAALCSVQGAQ